MVGASPISARRARSRSRRASREIVHGTMLEKYVGIRD
jgi:hypothetical protein